MHYEIKAYNYDNFPDFSDQVAGAVEITATGEEVGLEYQPDVTFMTENKTALKLQVIKPTIFNRPKQLFPGILFIQGSHWATQDIYHNVAKLGRLAQKGYVIFLMQYRDYEHGFHFPAPIIDAKNALRYLTLHPNEFSLDADNFIVMGDSSGGQVACMTGMTINTTLFDHPVYQTSIKVKGIIDLYGAVDLTLADGFPTTFDHQTKTSPEGRFMGFDINDNLEETQKACPKYYAEYAFSPILIAHGTKDFTVSCQESVDLYQALKQANKDAALYLLRGATHGHNAFWSKQMIDVYDQFIKHCLRS